MLDERACVRVGASPARLLNIARQARLLRDVDGCRLSVSDGFYACPCGRARLDRPYRHELLGIRDEQGTHLGKVADGHVTGLYACQFGPPFVYGRCAQMSKRVRSRMSSGEAPAATRDRPDPRISGRLGRDDAPEEGEPHDGRAGGTRAENGLVGVWPIKRGEIEEARSKRMRCTRAPSRHHCKGRHQCKGRIHNRQRMEECRRCEGSAEAATRPAALGSSSRICADSRHTVAVRRRDEPARMRRSLAAPGLA
jgi:hypothetical protein